MSTEKKAGVVPIETAPCQHCQCVGRGTAEKVKPNGEAQGVRWEDPREDCNCACHASWRMVNQRPAKPAASSAA